MLSLTCRHGFVALVRIAFLLPTVMLYFERTLMVFLLSHYCVENPREKQYLLNKLCFRLLIIQMQCENVSLAPMCC